MKTNHKARAENYKTQLVALGSSNHTQKWRLAFLEAYENYKHARAYLLPKANKTSCKSRKSQAFSVLNRARKDMLTAKAMIVVFGGAAA